MKKIVFLFFILFLSLTGFSQRSEIGFMLGTSYYQGELNGNNFFVAPQPAGGLLYRYAINPRWAFKMSAYYGTIAGDDANTGGDDVRNLSFQSFILDVSPQIEWNFSKYATGSRYPFSPYAFVGVSLFFFNPKAEYGGDWYDLQPLGTEGQGTTSYPDRSPYSLSQIAIPFGLGLKMSISKNTSFGIEIGIRKTFTDYLDDVSTTYADTSVLHAENTEISKLLADRSGRWFMEGAERGDEKDKDWYTFVGVTFTFKLTGKDKNCPAYDSGSNFREYFRFR